MKKNKKLLTALVLILMFSFSLMPMAFALDEEAAPVETATEISSDNSQALPVEEVATPEIVEEAAIPEAAQEIEEPVAVEVVEEPETVDDAAKPEAVEEEEKSEAAEKAEEVETKETAGASLYTVEFVNSENGSEVTIVGGSDIYFTVLNQELGLGVDIADVESIDSSNDELFEAQEIDGDYVIHTFQPFSSAEQLLVKLIGSGVVSVDVFDANYENDEGFQKIAASFTMSVDNGTWYVPTKSSVIKIQYLGKTWDVIGFNGKGIGAGADQMMLLLDDVAQTTQFNSSRNDGNNYSGSKLQSAMETYLDTITSGQDEKMTGLLADMTLRTAEYSDSNPYCDGVKGDSVTSKIRPLTTQEAMILTNFNPDCSNVVTSASGNWWLASPEKCTYQGDNERAQRDPNGTLSAEVVYSSGMVGNFKNYWDCWYVDYGDVGLRPALLLDLKSVISTAKVSDGVYKLVVASGDADFDAAPVYVRGLVYVDGKLINEGTDYNWVDGKLVLTDEFIKTLSEGTHKVAVLYTSVYGDALPSDFEYTAANSYDFTV